jgi:hypothetical protein
MFEEFPKWLYHRSRPAVIVNDPEEEDMLGPGWADTPAAFEGPAPEPTPAYGLREIRSKDKKKR